MAVSYTHLDVYKRQITDCYDEIVQKQNSENCLLISVTFVPDFMDCDFTFLANAKRYATTFNPMKKEVSLIYTSNIRANQEQSGYCVNYVSLLNEVDIIRDNSALMALNLLQKLSPRKLSLIHISTSNTDLYGSDINQLLNDYVCNKPCFHLFTSLGQKCYVSLLPQLYCMIGNSSSGVYETGYWKLPTINIGHRQEGRYMTSNIICCDNCSESIIQSLKKIETDEFQQMLKYIDNPYGDGNASKRIVEQIKMYFNAVK